MNKDRLEVLSPDKSQIIQIVDFMEKFYLNKGYKKINNNSLIGFFIKIRIKYFRKLSTIINLILKVKFIFKNPKKYDVIIYDCELTEYLERVLEEKSFYIISTRVHKIKKIYLSLNILKYIISNFSKRSLKQNYLLAIINIISPKIIITHIDNSVDFYITAKAFENSKIKFLAIQNSSREGVMEDLKNKNFKSEFLGFSNYDKKLFKENNFRIKSFNDIGSLKISILKEYISNKKLKITKDKYDICFISEPTARIGDYAHILDLHKIKGQVAEYVHRLCKNKKLKLMFSGKFSDKHRIEEENYFYSKFLKDYDFEIYRQKIDGSFATYINLLESKMVIGHNSTILREAIGLGKKVLACNFTNHPEMRFPYNGLCTITNDSYNNFEEKVLDILNMTEENYYKQLGDKADFIINRKVDTANFLRKKIKEETKEF